MPTTEIHSNTALGAVGAVIGAVFDLPPEVIFAGFLGTWIGLAIAPPKNYWRGAGYLIGGTVMAGFLTPLLLVVIGDYPARGVAFLLSVVIVGFEANIKMAIRNRIGTSIEGGEIPRKEDSKQPKEGN